MEFNSYFAYYLTVGGFQFYLIFEWDVRQAFKPGIEPMPSLS